MCFKTIFGCSEKPKFCYADFETKLLLTLSIYCHEQDPVRVT